MSSPIQERLYNLLPAIYRIRDAEREQPLRALMAVIETELQAIEDDISGLYRNWFIETCQEWIIPYIGEMLGVRTLHNVESVASYNLRAYVANTLAYRRRKGTPPVLEQIARDVTGWRSRVVEFFQLLSTTQHMNHIMLDRPATLEMRDPNALELLEGPFQHAAHTADVRRISGENGWYNIPNVGVFLYRLQPYLMTGAPPTRFGDGLYRFSALGHDMPLFHVPETEDEITHLAEETNVPTPIRRLAIYNDLNKFRKDHETSSPADITSNSDYYGPNRGINIKVNGEQVSPMNVVGANLSSWAKPAAGFIAVDPINGRLTFAEGEDPGTGNVLISYAYGFSADIGGGPYDRFTSMADTADAALFIQVAKGTSFNTIQSALSEWSGQGKPSGVIQIEDNGVYGGNVDIDLPDGCSLVIQAKNGVRPDVRLVGNATISGTESASLTLNGLLIEGALELEGDLELTLKHCTLVPGMRLMENGLPEFPDRDSIITTGADSDNPKVNIEQSIVGSIRLSEEARGLTARDSIIDACSVEGVLQPAISANDGGINPGPPTTLERVTVFGSVNVRQLDLASEVIFTDTVTAVRRQVGCVRFSYLPEGSQTPQRFHCQPDMALTAYAAELGKSSASALTTEEASLVYARVRPRFTSDHYGDPGYAQLSRLCAEEIRKGAEDGSEMGVFELLKQPQREANLNVSLEEYLPFGLEAGLIYVT